MTILDIACEYPVVLINLSYSSPTRQNNLISLCQFDADQVTYIYMRKNLDEQIT